jgi:hypothetical protein
MFSSQMPQSIPHGATRRSLSGDGIDLVSFREVQEGRFQSPTLTTHVRAVNHQGLVHRGHRGGCSNVKQGRLRPACRRVYDVCLSTKKGAERKGGKTG